MWYNESFFKCRKYWGNSKRQKWCRLVEYSDFLSSPYIMQDKITIYKLVISSVERVFNETYLTKIKHGTKLNSEAVCKNNVVIVWNVLIPQWIYLNYLVFMVYRKLLYKIETYLILWQILFISYHCYMVNIGRKIQAG